MKDCCKFYFSYNDSHNISNLQNFEQDNLASPIEFFVVSSFCVKSFKYCCLNILKGFNENLK